MKIRLALTVDGQTVKEHVLEIEGHKMDELDDDDKEAAIDIVIRSWVDEVLGVSWEVVEEEA